MGGEGLLKQFGPKPPNRFIRDGMVVTDIDGAISGHKHDKWKTRDHISCEDIEGAAVKDYYKGAYNKDEALKAMGVQSPYGKQINKTRKVKTSPLDPVYKVGIDEKGNPIEIGEISEQRPKKYENKHSSANKDNLQCSLSSVSWVDS